MSSTKEDQLKFLFDKNEEQERLLSGWELDDISRQTGGEPLTVSWHPQVRSTTAELLGLSAEATDEEIVPAFKRQLSLQNWAPFAIEVLREVCYNPNGSVRKNGFPFGAAAASVRSEVIFKYAWLYSVAMTFGKEFVKLVDSDLAFQDDEEQVTNLQEFAHLRTLSLNEFKEWWSQKDKLTNKLIINKKYETVRVISNSNSRVTKYVNSFLQNAIKSHFTYIPFLWPCQIPAISPITFLKYFFFDIAETEIPPQPALFFIIPSSMLSSVGNAPHDVDYLLSDEVYKHDDFHYHAQNDVISEFMESSFSLKYIGRMMRFLLKTFNEKNKQIIQQWCTNGLFQRVHEQRAVLEYHHGGWKYLFDGDAKVYPWIVAGNENALEKLFLSRAVQELMDECSKESECQSVAASLSSFIVPFEPNETVRKYITSKLVSKLFGNNPPMTMVPSINKGNLVSSEFSENLFEALDCLVRHTEFSPEDGFDWDEEFEETNDSVGGGRRKTKKRHRLTKQNTRKNRSRTTKKRENEKRKKPSKKHKKNI